MPRRTQRPTPGETPLTNPTGAAVMARAPSSASGEGFYQGLVGRKTGRPSPRPMGHGRGGPRHEVVMAAHGLMEQGAADPRQGQLFAPHEFPQAETAKALALKHGVAPPLAASRPGYMPELYERQSKGRVVTATTKEAHRAMTGAVNRIGRFQLEQSTTPPVQRAMAERATTRALHQGDAPWYASRTETSPGRYELGPGSATHMITAAAGRHGLSYEAMSRATAITSPRTLWTKGQEGTQDWSAPNLESASNVVGAVHQAQALERSHDIQFHPEIVGGSAGGASLGGAKAKAAADLVRSNPSRPIPISELQSQKVPNFNQSLLQAHVSQAVRRQAALSYTVDTHDVRSAGLHEDVLKTPGGMAIARMTGRRAALKNRELPTMGQSGMWMGQKSKESEPMGEHSLFETMRSGKIRPRGASNPNVVTSPSQFGDQRSETAKRLGLEF